MSKYGVMPADDLSGIVEGEIRRVNLGEFVVLEITDEVAAGGGFPGTVYATEEEARRVAETEAGVTPGPVEPPQA